MKLEIQVAKEYFSNSTSFT